MRAASKCHNSWSGAVRTRRQQRHVRARVRAAPAGLKRAVDPWEGGGGGAGVSYNPVTMTEEEPESQRAGELSRRRAAASSARSRGSAD